MICKPCQEGSHGLCNGSTTQLVALLGSDGRDSGETASETRKCDCQHRMPTDPTVDFYYAAARALDYLSMDDNYDGFRIHWAQISRQTLPHSAEDLALMAQRSRNSAVHYWQQLTGRSSNELQGEAEEKGNQETAEGTDSL